MKQLFGLGAFKNAPIRKKLILSTWLVAIVPIVVIFAVVFFVFVNTGAESARRQAQLLLDKTVEEMDGYFNQAQESLAFMVTDMNMQTAIDNYVSGTYKEQLDLRDCQCVHGGQKDRGHIHLYQGSGQDIFQGFFGPAAVQDIRRGALV